VRLFLAVRFPPDLAAEASAALPDLRLLRRVAPELMHVTLAFVGNVPESTLADATAAANEAADATPSFTLRIGALGQFPERGRPHVVWLGFTEPAPLTDLAARTRGALTAHGVSFDDKPFRPHLTLARVREEADRVEVRDLAIALRSAKPPLGTFTVDALHVIESTLSPKGPRYTARATAALGGRVG
jgi:RNA 2',3'-cyclic 3'-phosphodiesterase